MALDLAVLTFALLGLVFWPGLATASVLGVAQLASLAVNVRALLAPETDDAAQRALTVHCLLRVVALGCLVAEYARMRKAAKAAVAPA